MRIYKGNDTEVTLMASCCQIEPMEGLVVSMWTTDPASAVEFTDYVMEGRFITIHIEKDILGTWEDGVIYYSVKDAEGETMRTSSSDYFLRTPIDYQPVQFVTEEELEEKVDEALEKAPFKTINGESIKGEGDIEIQGSSKSQFVLTPNEDMTGFIEDEQYNALAQYAQNGGDPKECEVYFFNGSGYIMASTLDFGAIPATVAFNMGASSLTGYVGGEVQEPIVIIEIDPENIVTKDGIKTINGESLLGEGDIEIQGGGDSDLLLKKDDIDLDAIPVGSVFTDGVNVFQKVEKEMDAFTLNKVSDREFKLFYVAIPEAFYGQKVCRFHYYDDWGYAVHIVDKNTLNIERVAGSFTDGKTITKGETFEAKVNYGWSAKIGFEAECISFTFQGVGSSVDQLMDSRTLISFAEQVDGRDRLKPIEVSPNNAMMFPKWNDNGIVTGYANDEVFTTDWCTVNGVLTKLCGPSNYNSFKTFTIFGPTTAGTKGQVLKSNGSGAPVWEDAPQFKTINGESIEGTGDIEIQGGESYDGNIYLSGSSDSEEWMRTHNKKVWDMLEDGTYRGGSVIQYLANGTKKSMVITDWFKAMGKYTFTAEYYDGSSQQMYYNTVSLWETSASLSAYNAHTIQRKLTAGDGIAINGTTISTTHQIWIGTKAEYDAITTKDNNTVYLIKE